MKCSIELEAFGNKAVHDKCLAALKAAFPSLTFGSYLNKGRSAWSASIYLTATHVTDHLELHRTLCDRAEGFAIGFKKALTEALTEAEPKTEPVVITNENKSDFVPEN